MPSRYYKEVEEIVFLYLGLIFSFFINGFWFLFYKNFIIASILILIAFLLFFLKNIIIKMATKRYITRNTKLYLNYLL